MPTSEVTLGVLYAQKNVVMPIWGAVVQARYSSGASGAVKAPEVFTAAGLKISLALRYGETIVPGSVIFTLGGKIHFDRSGSIYTDLDLASGSGTLVGTISYLTGEVGLTSWQAGAANTITVQSLLTQMGDQMLSTATFRVPMAPLRVGSFQLLATRKDGSALNVSADVGGAIAGDGVRGSIDYMLGIVAVEFGRMVPAEGNEDEPWYSADAVVGGQIWKSESVFADTIKYNAVAYSYLPMDAELLGLDPVRLPQDGRVPIYRVGGFVVLGHQASITAIVAAGQTINCARVRLSRVNVIGDDGVEIHTGYEADLDAGTVHFTDVSGYSQPVTIEHRIEDMARLSDVQISGQLAFTRPVTHDYPLGSYVSSALMLGNRKARVSVLFDQGTHGPWADSLQGEPATGTYNDVLAPVAVTNRGALTERWALVFTNTTTFNIIGEHVGLIGTGTTGLDCEPMNPAAGVPYFSLPALGWGGGWSPGNVLRINTIGAAAPVWFARTVQQGLETVLDDSFSVIVRGGVNRP